MCGTSHLQEAARSNSSSPLLRPAGCRYEASTIRELFSSFQESIERYLLFLRNVDTIEVYVHGATHGVPGGDDDSEPRTELLYRASRTLQSRSSWQSVSWPRLPFEVDGAAT